MCDEKLKISIDKKFVYHQLKKQKKKNQSRERSNQDNLYDDFKW